MADRLYSRPEGNTQRLADELEKPLLDDRTYRVIELPNKLQALLIHDPDTDKAAAAMDVNVGSLSDPEDMQGVAHAVEHALFMGTRKVSLSRDELERCKEPRLTGTCSYSTQARTTTTRTSPSTAAIPMHSPRRHPPTTTLNFPLPPNRTARPHPRIPAKRVCSATFPSMKHHSTADWIDSHNSSLSPSSTRTH